MQLRFHTHNSGADSTPLVQTVIAETAPDDGVTTLDRYLDQVETRLNALPIDVRADIRRELRQHLESAIVAHEELGDDHEAATISAMRQFGEPQVIARRFCRAWNSTMGDTPWEAMRESLRVSTVAMAVYVGVCLAMLGVVMAHYSLVTEALTTAWCWGGMWLVPTLAGARVGWKFPKRSGLGWFYALTIQTIVVAPLYFGIVYLGNSATGGYSQSVALLERIAQIASSTAPSPFSLSWCAYLLSSFLTPAFGLWLPIGCLAAAVAGELKQRQTSRRLASLPFAKG